MDLVELKILLIILLIDIPIILLLYFISRKKKWWFFGLLLTLSGICAYFILPFIESIRCIDSPNPKCGLGTEIFSLILAISLLYAGILSLIIKYFYNKRRTTGI